MLIEQSKPEIEIVIPTPKMKNLEYNESYPWYHPTSISQLILQADSKLARQVMSRPERGTFLDMEYLLAGKASHKGIFGGSLDRYFMNSPAGKSIKTRTEEAQSSVYKYLEQLAGKNGGEVNVLCLGSGIGREVMYPLKKFNENGGDFKASADFVDYNEEAISASRRLAKEIGVDKNINHLKRDLLDVRNLPGKYDIVTAIGVNEYFDDENSKLWFKHHVKGKIKTGGVLIATNMKEHGKLTMFSMNKTGWKLDYKDLDQLTGIIRESGLEVKEAYYEPLGLHSFVIGERIY